MGFKNKIEFEKNEIPADQSIIIDGITFSGIIYITIKVDGSPLVDLPEFEDSFVVGDQLKRSALSSGEYLIFTSATGVADDAGWDLVEVSHSPEGIEWHISRDEKRINYLFDRCEYEKGVSDILSDIEDSKSTLSLEPKFVIFPE